MMVDHNNIGNHSMDRSIQRLLLAGGLIVSLAMGIRHGFGFFMPPMMRPLAGRVKALPLHWACKT
jgi:hypothetical protein